MIRHVRDIICDRNTILNYVNVVVFFIFHYRRESKLKRHYFFLFQVCISHLKALKDISNFIVLAFVYPRQYLYVYVLRNRSTAHCLNVENIIHFIYIILVSFWQCEFFYVFSMHFFLFYSYYLRVRICIINFKFF